MGAGNRRYIRKPYGSGGIAAMKSTLIKDTTKEERIALIRQWQEPEDGIGCSGMDLFGFYANYINRTKEIAECNAAFSAEYMTEEDF